MDLSRVVALSACALVAVSCSSGSAPDSRSASGAQTAPATTTPAPAPDPQSQMQRVLASHEQEWLACLKSSREGKVVLDKMRKALIEGNQKQIDALDGPMKAASAGIKACNEKKASIVKELEATGASPAVVEAAWNAFNARLETP